MFWLIMTLLKRTILLRCPRCGRGKQFKSWFTMYERCSYCSWHFEREEGYWTGAMAVNLVVAELLIAAAVIPLAAMQTPYLPLFAIGLPCTVLLPLLFFRHSRSFWMGLDFLINPVDLWM
jgi:uncharacterized protein (DUF983 family)